MRQLIILAAALSISVVALGGQVGRFQVIQVGSRAMDQFLIDTETGDIWRAVCAENCTYMVWQRELVEGKNYERPKIHSKANIRKKEKNLFAPPTDKERQEIGADENGPAPAPQLSSDSSDK